VKIVQILSNILTFILETLTTKSFVGIATARPSKS